MRTRTTTAVLAVTLALALSGCESTTAPRDGEGSRVSRLMMEPIDPIDPGDPGDGGGGTPCCTTPTPTPTVPPFSPPPRPFFTAPMGPPVFGGFSGGWQSCNQVAHVGIAFSNDVVRGATLYRWGVAVPGSIATFNIYNQFGQLVMSTNTQRTRDNCVIHHEPEAFSTWGFNPGYYYVYASYWALSSSPPFETFSGTPLGLSGRYITVFRVR